MFEMFAFFVSLSLLFFFISLFRFKLQGLYAILFLILAAFFVYISLPQPYVITKQINQVNYDAIGTKTGSSTITETAIEDVTNQQVIYNAVVYVLLGLYVGFLVLATYNFLVFTIFRGKNYA